MELLIKRYALLNAVQHNGKANPKAVIGKLIQENPSLKKNIKELLKRVTDIVEEINAMPLEEQRELLQEFKIEKPKKKTEEEIKPLPNVKGSIVMRFEPSPSGPLHIGHIHTLLLNDIYCKLYKGRLYLRISDTNPENMYLPAYQMIPEDAKWLAKIYKTIVQSERLEIYYKYAEKLIKQGHAYVCTCKQEKFKELASKSKPCPCRELPPKEHLSRWKKMFSSFQPGEAVLRIKTDIKHKNPAVRDWPAFRIIKEKHPKKPKARVWPLMNFSVAIDDILQGMTHIIRGKDHIVNTERQLYLYRYLNKKEPVFIHIGRINFTDLKISTTEIRKSIQAKKFIGWDDPRLPFLRALKRRGYQREAFVKLTKHFGLSKVDKKISKNEFFKLLNAYNKEIIEPLANRYFFIENPKLVEIKNAPELTVKIPLHPDFPERGYRLFKTSTKFYVQDKLEKNKIYRFMHLFNFKNKQFLSIELDPKLNAKLIHWLPASKDLVKVEIMMPDASIKQGLAEPAVRNLEVDSIIQFERFGFCRLDKKLKHRLVFWFAHK